MTGNLNLYSKKVCTQKLLLNCVNKIELMAYSVCSSKIFYIKEIKVIFVYYSSQLFYVEQSTKQRLKI